MHDLIKISEKVLIPVRNYANQGNSIIGIRGSGKSYTATKIAEELIKAGIPIVAFDPTGLWQYLRYGVDGHKGMNYVIVAGGMKGDITLDETNAIKILEVALKEGLSVIFDLQGVSTSNKSKWLRIVSDCVEYLMANNLQKGLRHVFIEEAAEFVPQKIQPGAQLVYSRIESMARIGRNFGLGYTLINQRAEEISKAIFEISEMVIVHRQSGKNSLYSIKNWLDVKGVASKNIVESLPKLENGQCWLISEIGEKLINVLPKETFHPDPKKGILGPSVDKSFDMSPWIQQIKDVIADKDTTLNKKTVKTDSSKELEELKKLADFQHQELHKLREEVEYYKRKWESIRNLVIDNNVTNDPKAYSFSFTGKELDLTPLKLNILSELSETKLSKCPKAILTFLATYPKRSFTKPQIAIATGYSAGSGGFNNALSELSTKLLIQKNGSKISVNGSADLKSYLGNYKPQKYSLEAYRNKLGKCEREIYEVLLRNPHSWFMKEKLAKATDTKYSHNSGGFNNAISRLNTLEIIKRENGSIKLNPELLEIG